MIARAAVRQLAFIEDDVIEDEGRARQIAGEREEGRDRSGGAVQPRERDVRQEGACFGSDADAGAALVDLAEERGERREGFDPRPHHMRRSEEHTSELQSLKRISYAVFCLQKKNINTI